MTDVKRLEEEVRPQIIMLEKNTAERIHMAAGARLDGANYERLAAKLKAAPHAIYGAVVWRLGGKNGREWVCELPPPRGMPSSIKRRRPKAYGDTPEQACDNFDHLWEHGRKLLEDDDVES
jgi:hypothetical protein